MEKYCSEFGETPEMDNAEPTPTDVAWLAGILDGEGSLVTSVLKTRKVNSIGFHIRNSDLLLLGKCQMIIQALINKPIKIYSIKFRKNPIFKSQKLEYSIDFRAYKDVFRVLTVLYPHLTSKKRKAGLILDYLKVRLEEFDTRHKSANLTPKAKEAFKYLMKHWRGVETERTALGNEMKPQSELTSNRKSVAEMSTPYNN